MKRILKALLEPINQNYDKILHLAVSFMLFTILLVAAPYRAWLGIIVLLIGIGWELLRKWLYSIPVSSMDMLFNLIGVVIAIIVSLI